MSVDNFMEDNATKTQILYIEKEVRSISKALNEFIISQRAEFISLGTVFVRKDVLAEQFKNIEKILRGVDDNYQCLKKIVDEHNAYLPMIEDIKKERDSIKNQIINYTGKILLWVIAILLGINAFK